MMAFMALSLQPKFSNAQAPQKFNYQGIARDAKGNPVGKQTLGIKLSVLPAQDATTPEYEEVQTITTNEFGLYTLQIGNGTAVTGSLSQVKWETGNKYIRVAIDPTGGTQYADAGTSQLLSVPYALYANQSGVSKESVNSTRATNNFIEKTNGSGVANSTSQLYDNGTNIGYGTTSPVAKFHISNTVAAVQEQLRMQNLSATGAGRFTLYNDGASSYATFTKYGTTYAGGYAGVSTLYPYANLLAFGNNGIASGDGNGRFLISTAGNAGISMYKGGTSKLKFHADFATENVGIGGNASPVSRVHLNNTDGTNLDLRLTNTTSGHTVSDGLLIQENGTTATIMNTENDALVLGTNNTEHMRIDNAGNVGIGVTAPLYKLHVSDSTGKYALIENSSLFGLQHKTGLLFKSGNYFTGGVKTIGTSSASARLGFYSGLNSNESGLTEKMTITGSGLVGINDTTPSYTLDVNGDIRGTGYLYSNYITSYTDLYAYQDAWIDGTLDADGNTDLGSNLHVAGTSSLDGTVNTNAGLNTYGEITCSNGNGIVKSNSSTQLRMGFTSGNVQATVGSNGSVSATFNVTAFSGTNSNVRVSIAQFQPASGSGTGYAHFIMTPHDVNDTNNTVEVTFFNAGSTTASFDGTLYLLCVATD